MFYVLFWDDLDNGVPVVEHIFEPGIQKFSRELERRRFRRFAGQVADAPKAPSI